MNSLKIEYKNSNEKVSEIRIQKYYLKVNNCLSAFVKIQNKMVISIFNFQTIRATIEFIFTKNL